MASSCGAYRPDRRIAHQTQGAWRAYAQRKTEAEFYCKVAWRTINVAAAHIRLAPYDSTTWTYYAEADADSLKHYVYLGAFTTSYGIQVIRPNFTVSGYDSSAYSSTQYSLLLVQRLLPVVILLKKLQIQTATFHFHTDLLLRGCKI